MEIIAAFFSVEKEAEFCKLTVLIKILENWVIISIISLSFMISFKK